MPISIGNPSNTEILFSISAVIDLWEDSGCWRTMWENRAEQIAASDEMASSKISAIESVDSSLFEAGNTGCYLIKEISRCLAR